MSWPVLTDDTAMVAVATDREGSGPVTICPLTSLKVPRTRLIRCRTAKPTLLCAGSIVHVPAVHPSGAGTPEVVMASAVVVISKFAFSWSCITVLAGQGGSSAYGSTLDVSSGLSHAFSSV